MDDELRITTEEGDVVDIFLCYIQKKRLNTLPLQSINRILSE